MTKNFLFLTVKAVLLSSISLTASAELMCVNGDPSAINIVTQLANAKTEKPVTKYIYGKYNINNAKSEGGTTCLSGDCEKPLIDAKPIEQIRNTLTPQTDANKFVFNDQCLQTSAKFNTGTSQLMCPEHKNFKRSKSVAGLCITNEQLSYQNAVMSDFAKCAASAKLSSVDMNAIFQKYAVESTFKPQYAYGGGVGIGQLTGGFVDDIFQKGRGLETLKDIANSTTPECAGAKLIAQADVEKRPKFSDKCAFVEVGEGFERNFLYSLIGTNTKWEKDIKPKLSKYLDKFAKDPDVDRVKQLLLMTAYGPGGAGAARTLISYFSKLPPAKFIQRLSKPFYVEEIDSEGNVKRGKNLTAYISQIEKRQTDFGKSLTANTSVASDELKASFKEKGVEACLNR